MLDLCLIVDEIGMIIIEAELVILLGPFQTKAMVLVGLSMDPILDLGLDCVPWIGLVLGPLRDLLGPCLRKANLNRHRPVFISLSRH